MRQIVGLCAIAALAACGTSGGGGPALEAADDPTTLFPLGSVIGTPVNVMSADRQAGNTVTVSREDVQITLNSFDAVAGTFDLDVSLPNGTTLNLTDQTNTTDLFGPLQNQLQGFELTTEAGDVVQVAVGFDLPTPVPPPPGSSVSSVDYEPRTVEDVILVVARANLAEEDGEKDLDGFNTYVAFGDEAETLPTGWAEYEGLTAATVYDGGDRIGGDFLGTAHVIADFDALEVDIALRGQYGDYSYSLVGEDIPVDGSQYDGALAFDSEFRRPILKDTVEVCCLTESVDIVGEVVGAFFGDDALATAGVFGAEETDHERIFNDENVEIVGGYAAYSDEVVDVPIPR